MEMEIWPLGRVFPLKADPSARLLVPVKTKLREAINAGEELVGVETPEGGFEVKTYAEFLRDVQNYFAARIPVGVSLSDELIEERRAEAEHE